MPKIKVIHIITMLEMGGAQGNTLFTVARLDRAKFEVGLIAGPGGLLDEEARKIPGLNLEFAETLVRNVSPVKDLLCLIELTRILKREKPDIVHTHSSKAGILGRAAALLAGVPKIVHTIHGFGFNPYQNPLARRLFIFLETAAAKFTDALIAVSQKNIETGIQSGIGNRGLYTLIRSGVDIEKIRREALAADVPGLRKELGISPGAKVVLTLGPFKIQKDPVAFVECAARVRKVMPEVLFLWSGDGELRPRVSARISELGLEDSVKILGWRKDIPALLKLCDLFVLTSLWEGLPRSGVEALVLGKPVVAYSADGIPEIVKNGENGFLIPPGSEEEFASRVVQILRDDSLYEKMRENALNSIGPSFDIHGMVKRQEDLYDNLFARRK